jgi:hypothetical protein
MFVSPSSASLAIFPDKNSKTHARATVAVLACRTIFHQSIAQLIMISGWPHQVLGAPSQLSACDLI